MYINYSKKIGLHIQNLCFMKKILLIVFLLIFSSFQPISVAFAKGNENKQGEEDNQATQAQTSPLPSETPPSESLIPTNIPEAEQNNNSFSQNSGFAAKITPPKTLIVYPNYKNIYAEQKLPPVINALILSSSIFSLIFGVLIVKQKSFESLLGKIVFNEEKLVFRPLKLQSKTSKFLPSEMSLK